MHRNLLIGTIALSVLVFLGIRLRIYSGSCGQLRLSDFNCSELLEFSEAINLERNDPTLQKIKRSNPQYFIGVSVTRKPNCPSKGIVIITHPSSKDCDAINRILKEGKFKAPYYLAND